MTDSVQRAGTEWSCGGGGAYLWLAVYVPYSVLAMAWSGEQRDFVVELFIQMADRQ